MGGWLNAVSDHDVFSDGKVPMGADDEIYRFSSGTGRLINKVRFWFFLGGKGHHSHQNKEHSHGAYPSEEVKALQIKVAELIEQNNKLTKEIQAMKNDASAEEVKDEYLVNYYRFIS